MPAAHRDRDRVRPTVVAAHPAEGIRENATLRRLQSAPLSAVSRRMRGTAGHSLAGERRATDGTGNRTIGAARYDHRDQVCRATMSKVRQADATGNEDRSDKDRYRYPPI